MFYEVVELNTNNLLYLTNDYEKAKEWAKFYKEELKIDILIVSKG